MMKADLVRMRHILDAIANIEEFAYGIKRDNFMQDKKTIKAVICELENIGEAMNNISDDFRAMYVDIPYSKIIGMRHILIHEYFGVHIETIWDTIQNDIPELKRQVQKAIENLEKTTT